ncbi:MAG: glycosyltransferase family 2 protein [Anaerolineaceae bacterium]|nr:glycosyltransferase family 2 protein [Anaerolineaceae bacterium]
MKQSRHSVDIVIPVFNEEEAIIRFHQHLSKVLDALPYVFSIIYVNDGSKDQTQQRLSVIATGDARVVVIELSRNFGHQSALTAGLDHADADFVITMDGDGEHPPELIPEMLALAQTGYDLVLTQRMEQENISKFKRWTSNFFYRLINRMGDTQILPGGADFRLMTRNAVLALRSMPEYHRFLRGMVSWMGFRSVILPYQPAERLGGSSKYSLKKMVSLSLDAVFSFSLMPLYISMSMGALFLLLALIEAVYVLSFWVTGRTESLAPGWSSLMFVLLVVGGTIMVILGFIGIYVGYIFQEVKQRPAYLIRDILSKETDFPGGKIEMPDA